MRILLFLFLGGAIGTVSGAVGIGGGVLFVPALMWLCGMEYEKATGTTLAILALPVFILAAWKSWQQDRVDMEAAIWIGVAFACGAYLGAASFHSLPSEALRLTFGLLLMFVAMRYILGSNHEAASAAAGLTAWLAYHGLRRLGRRHLAAPDLGSLIREKAEQQKGESDYYI